MKKKYVCAKCLNSEIIDTKEKKITCCSCGVDVNYPEGVLLAKLDEEILKLLNENLDEYEYSEDCGLINKIGSIFEEKEDYDNAIVYYKMGVKFGSDESNIRLGDLWFYGRGCKQSNEKAIKFYGKAAINGNPSALLTLKNLVTNLFGYDELKEPVIEIFKELAEKGNVICRYYLGCGYASVNKYTDALEAFKLASKEGITNATAKVGRYYLYGVDIEEDYEKAFLHLEEAAEKLDAEAQFLLGRAYTKGFGVEIDYDKGLNYLLLSGNQDHKEAVRELCGVYDEGIGREQNLEEAYKWYEKAEEINAFTDFCKNKDRFEIVKVLVDVHKNDAEAQYEMGYWYFDGDNDFEEDEEKAIEYFKLASDQNHLKATAKLADYYYGDVLLNKEDAHKDSFDLSVKYFKKAALLGDANSLHHLLGLNLGPFTRDVYNFGPEKSIELYEIGYKNKEPIVTCAYASMYLEGKGVEKDVPKAIEMYETVVRDLRLFKTQARDATSALIKYYYRTPETRDLEKALEIAKLQRGYNLGNNYASLASEIEKEIRSLKAASSDLKEVLCIKCLKRTEVSKDAVKATCECGREYNAIEGALLALDGEGIIVRLQEEMQDRSWIDLDEYSEGFDTLAVLQELYSDDHYYFDRDEADRYAIILAELNVEYYKNLVAKWYINSKKPEKIEVGIRYLEEIIASGGRAFGDLARCYDEGIGFETNIEKAVELYKLGVEAGEYNSKNRLGELYEAGICVEKNMQKAIELYKGASKISRESKAHLERLRASGEYVEDEEVVTTTTYESSYPTESELYDAMHGDFRDEPHYMVKSLMVKFGVAHACTGLDEDGPDADGFYSEVSRMHDYHEYAPNDDELE